MTIDPAIETTRAARRAISAAVGDDPARMIDYYLKTQERFGRRLRHGPCESGEEVEQAEQRRPTETR